MEPKGFLAALFDTSFSSLITTRVIKAIYIISMAAIALVALFWVAAAFARSVALGVLVLIILAPVVSLLYLIYTRVLLEVIIALFRIMETNVELVELQRSAVAPAAPPPSAPPSSTPPPPPEAPTEPDAPA